MKTRPIRGMAVLVAVAGLGMMGMSVQAALVPLNLLNDEMRWATTDSPINATRNWDNTDTYIAWQIEAIGGGEWRYHYTWSSVGRDLSHLIIEITDGAKAVDFYDWKFSHALEKDPQFGTYVGTGNSGSNPHMPTPIYGFKLDFDEDTPMVTFAFTTLHSPTWGDFYAKDGNSIPTRAFNVGFSAAGVGGANDGTRIAVPNGIPVPDGGLTAMLLGLGLLGLGGLKRTIRD